MEPLKITLKLNTLLHKMAKIDCLQFHSIHCMHDTATLNVTWHQICNNIFHMFGHSIYVTMMHYVTV